MNVCSSPTTARWVFSRIRNIGAKVPAAKCLQIDIWIQVCWSKRREGLETVRGLLGLPVHQRICNIWRSTCWTAAVLGERKVRHGNRQFFPSDSAKMNSTGRLPSLQLKHWLEELSLSRERAAAVRGSLTGTSERRAVAIFLGLWSPWTRRQFVHRLHGRPFLTSSDSSLFFCGIVFVSFCAHVQLSSYFFFFFFLFFFRYPLDRWPSRVNVSLQHTYGSTCSWQLPVTLASSAFMQTQKGTGMSDHNTFRKVDSRF